jgi:Fic family protein
MEYYRLMLYNWQQSDWPNFRYDLTGMEALFLEFAEKSGVLRGLLSGLDPETRDDSAVANLVSEAVSTSAIEGETLRPEEVMSSICNQLGRNLQPVPVHDRRSEGVATLLLDVRKNYSATLDEATLLRWHRILFEGWAPRDLMIGAFRTHGEPMRVITKRPEADEIRFEAPPSARMPFEMERFIHWFNTTAPGAPHALAHPTVRAAIAHLYFESIHPFEDGNGRIGRALTGKALAQYFSAPPLLPISATLNRCRKAYYDALHSASLSNDLTEWIHTFTSLLIQSQNEVEGEVLFLVEKIRFFVRVAPLMNPRQAKVLDRMAREGRKGFAGGMNASKYQTIAKTSKATATRDLSELHTLGALTRTGAGPGVRYHLPFTD